jgi:PAS domain S-box-containing protein
MQRGAPPEKSGMERRVSDIRPTSHGPGGTRRGGLRVAIIAFALAVITAFWVAAFVLGHYDHERTLFEIDDENRSLSRTLAEHAARTFDYADGLALAVKAWHEQSAHGTASYQGNINRKIIFGVYIADARGDVRRLDGPLERAANIADREHFKMHVATDSGQANISRLIPMRAQGGNGIILSRRLNRSGGEFDGIVSVVIDPDVFTGFYREIGLGDHGIIALAGLDGNIRARNTRDDTGSGSDVRGGTLFKEYSARAAGVARFSSIVDGILRRAAFRRLDNYPMALIVGVAEVEALADVYARNRMLYAGAAVATLLALGAAAALLLVIHRREKDALALAESREQFRQVTENIGDVFWLTDPAKQKLIYASPAYAHVWGRRLDDVYRSGQEWVEGIHPDDRERVLRAVRTQQASGEYDEQYRVLRPDGSIRWVRDRAYPVRDADGKVVRVAGIAEDITDVRELEQTYRRIVENSPDPTFINRGEAILYANAAAVRMLRADSAAQVVGMSPLDIVHPDDRAAARERIDRHLAGGSIEGLYEQRYVALDGTVIDTELSVALMLFQGEMSRQVVVRDVTQRKKIEAALRDSEGRYRALVDSSPDAIFIHSDGVIEFVNAAGVRMLGGTSADDIIGRPMLQFVRADGHAAMLERRKQGALTGRPTGLFEQTIVRMDGGEVEVEGNAIPLDGAGGGRRMVVLRDISARKRAEAALDESEARLRLAVEAAGMIDWQWNVASDETWWGAGHERLLGPVPPGANRYPDFRKMVHVEDRERFLAAGRATLEAGAPYEVEFRVVRTDGRACWLRHTGRAMRGAHGRIERLVGVTQDVTRRREMEQELVESQRRRDALLESIPDPAWLKAVDGSFIAANRAWFARLGIEPRDIAGCAEVEFFGDERAKVLRAEDQQVVEARKTFRKERDWGFGGNVEWIETVKSPVFDSAGNVVAIVGISHDITERKRNEQALEQTNESLLQRTAELNAVNAEQEAFAYSISHDLRAPLRRISGFIKLMLQENLAQLDAEGRGRLERIGVASAHAHELIDDLLGLSRVSRRPLALRAVDLSVVAAEVAASLVETDPQRKVEFAIAPDLTVNADAGLMRAVLDNLIGNAWKFTAGRASARVEFGRAQVGGERAFFVRDNGAGFDMAYAARLFTPFQRMHTQEQFEGTGIGLATVKRILDRHRGRVWIESAVDAGTTVYFTVGRVA